MRLHLDFETRSTVPLTTAGVYRYAEDPSTEVILACYAIDDAPVKTWFSPAPIPDDLHAVLLKPDCIVVAHNAGFERQMLRHVLSRHNWPDVAIERWDDTAARAARMSLPRALGDAANALGLAFQKDVEGKALMMRMCRPRTNVDGEVTWWDDEVRMQRLAEYCATDVEVERELDRVLRPLSKEELKIWQLTELVNDRGIAVDHAFAKEAVCLATAHHADLNRELYDLTEGIAGASTNVGAIKEWMYANGYYLLQGEDEGLNKKAIENLLKNKGLDETVRRVLEIRRDGGKSSIAKYKAISSRVSKDGRVRGNLVFCGASTGRFTGTGIQIQNLPRDVVKNWDTAKKKLPDDPQRLLTLSKMIRGTLCAPKGKRLMWADYNAVEARGLAWICDEQKLISQFQNNAPIYEEMAAKIFRKDVAEIKKDGIERWVGKTTILGCGYSMGAKKFRMTCAAMGQEISEELATQAVYAFRNEYPHIPVMWDRLFKMAVTALETGKTTKYRNIKISANKEWMVVVLPSGRELFYRNPRILEVSGSFKRGKAIEFMSVNQTTKQWGWEQTYGGKLVENVVQAICRDILCGAMLDLEAKGYRVIASVHDEIICEVPEGFGSIEEMVAIMCELPTWAKGFPLAAEGKQGVRYGK